MTTDPIELAAAAANADRPQPKPYALEVDGVAFPTVKPLFSSIDEAHADMMAAFDDAYREMKAEGIPVPSFARFCRDTRIMWDVYRRYL